MDFWNILLHVYFILSQDRKEILQLNSGSRDALVWVFFQIQKMKPCSFRIVKRQISRSDRGNIFMTWPSTRQWIKSQIETKGLIDRRLDKTNPEEVEKFKIGASLVCGSFHHIVNAGIAVTRANRIWTTVGLGGQRFLKAGSKRQEKPPSPYWVVCLCVL